MNFKKKVTLIKIVLLIIFILRILLNTTTVKAEISDYINAAIKISICGNEIVEGGEDCEGVNLNNQDCQSLGFGPGTLSCDIACSFDTYNCSPAPTLTPTPTQTLTPTPTQTLTPTPTQTSTPTPTPIPNVILTVTPTVISSSRSSSSNLDSDSPILPSTTLTSNTSPPVNKQLLPDFLTFFDSNQDGLIVFQETFFAVKKWVEEWKNYLTDSFNQKGKNILTTKEEKKCDLNQDSKINLIDFSILMSYVQK